MWRLISNQSERQLGTFYITYLNEFKSVPPNFVEKYAAFRNKVIHKGYIPLHIEARQYAEEAFKYILNSLHELRRSYADSIRQLTLINLQQAIPPDNKLPISTMANSSVLALISGEEDWENRSFDKVLNEFRERREMLKQLPNHQLLLTHNAEHNAKKAVYRAHFDPTNGKILGFYPSIIDYSAIPEPYINLTYEEWQECIKNQGSYMVDTVENKLVYNR